MPAPDSPAQRSQPPPPFPDCEAGCVNQSKGAANPALRSDAGLGGREDG